MKDRFLGAAQKWIDRFLWFSPVLILILGVGIILGTSLIDLVRGSAPNFGSKQVAILVYGIVITAISAGLLLQRHRVGFLARIAPGGIMIALVAVYALLQVLFGERIPFGDGLGWDGTIYGNMVVKFPEILVGQELNSYYIQRSLPPFLIAAVMHLFKIPFTDLGIIYTFRVYDGLLLVLSAFLWVRIAAHLNLTPRANWLGFVLLFGSFTVLKWWFYYPVLTDQSGFALAMLTLFYFLKRSRLGLTIVTILASFTWPAILYLSAFLFLFPEKQASEQPSQPAPHHANWLVGGLIASGVFLILISQVYTTGNYLVDWTNHVDLPVLSLALFITVLSIFLAMSLLFDHASFFNLSTYTRAFSWSGLLIFALIYAASSFISKAFGTTTENYAYPVIFSNLLLIAQSYPGLVLVAHSIFFGPVILLLLLWFHRITKILHKFGKGLSLMFAVGLFFSLIDAESRHLVMIMPLFVVLVALASEQILEHNWQIWLIAAVALLGSKVWFSLNVGDPWKNILHVNLGPWLSLEAYAIQLLLIVVLMILFYVCFQPRAKA